MAILTVRRLGSLAEPAVLAPERYDPRREMAVEGPSVALSDLVEVVRAQVSTRTGGSTASRYVVLDTSDVAEGMVTRWRPPVDRADLGSQKKRLRHGDVVISRLRPYLRQVAWVDPCVAAEYPDCELACSTEFHVLRAVEGDAAFLVPWLLSHRVQASLAASQEGGHHPRFDVSVLLAVRVPMTVVDQRIGGSRDVAIAVDHYRRGVAGMGALVAAAESLGLCQEAVVPETMADGG